MIDFSILNYKEKFQGETMIAIEANNLTKNYKGFTALDKLSLNVMKGECFGILGPNGAGKSTLISILYGAKKSDSGTLKILDQEPSRKNRWLKEKIGIVTQENCLDESLNVFQNMMIYSQYLSIPKKKAKNKISELLEFMSLYHKKDFQIAELSGGMKRRLAFVRALLSDPEILILDEPTTGLDPAVRKLMWNKIIELKSDKKMTILISTHYMDEAEQLADKIVIIDKGKFQVQDHPKQIVKKYCPGYIAFFTKQTLSESIYKKYVNNKTIFNCNLHPYLCTLRYLTLDDLYNFIKKVNIQPELIRPSNLEDVFLTLTGRKLSEHA